VQSFEVVLLRIDRDSASDVAMASQVQVSRLPLSSNEPFVRGLFKNLAARIRSVKVRDVSP
jgi:hypothetical protein